MPMRDHKSERIPVTPWHVPVAVEDIPEGGQSFTLEPDAETRAAIAALAGLRDLPQLAATFDLTRQGTGGLRVVGQLSATAGQTCVVTLEPLLNAIEENVDLLFMPQTVPPGPLADNEPLRTSADAKLNGPEPLIDGAVDLGALAIEFLILGLDPYPRKPGVAFEAPREHASDAGPFAALSGWSKGRNGR
jgi:hypothetical protein